MTTRRRFLAQSASALAGAYWLQSSDAFGQSSSYLHFDLHSHPGMFLTKGVADNVDAAVAKTIGEMNKGRLTGAFFSLVADAPIIKVGAAGIEPNGSYASGDAWKEYKRQLGILKEYLKSMPVTFATKASDLQSAMQTNKVAAYIGCEGGDFLEGKADRLDEMYADGVRSIQLVHYHVNELGNLQTQDAQYDNGLSASGKEVVKKMNKLGMVIDVAHAAESTAKAVVDMTDSPIILSHSILRVDDKRPLAKRAITADHAKLIAKNGGVIGAWPSGFSTSFDDFIDNVKRTIDVAGVDHVGLGTDMDGNFKPVLASYLQLSQWADALKKKGFTEDEVKKITGGNAERVLKKVLK
ncbi:MAG TPA: membrane dipeptidase [Cyclobacteriaceae bacterium]|nr:membrane dipeptidase [Cyclobacteriaceae bacterium]